MIAAAGVACLVDLAILAAPPRLWTLDTLAVAQTGALVAGLAALLALSPFARPTWPRWRDVVGIPLATLAMLGVGAPLRAMLDPGVGALLAQTLCGCLVYGGLVLAFDIAGLRGALRALALSQKKRAANGRP